MLSGVAALACRLMAAAALLQFGTKFLFAVSLCAVSGFALARAIRGEAWAFRWAGNLGLTLVSFGFAIVITEFALRFALAGITTTSDNSSYWANRWNRGHVRLNSLGFRERPVAKQAPPGVLRIAVIGDSYTFGQGIEEAERFSNLIEERLNRSGPRFEVLNFGRPGAETVDEVEILQKTVLPLEPNFVLLQWYTNDVEGRDKSERPKYYPLLPSSAVSPLLHRHSVLYYVANRAWMALQDRLGLVRSHETYMLERFRDPRSAKSLEAAAALAAFGDIGAEHRIPWGIVLFPNPGHQDTVSSLDFLLERVLAFCSSSGILCVDLRTRFRHSPPEGGFAVNRFDAHPNAAANLIAADEILKQFSPLWNSMAARLARP